MVGPVFVVAPPRSGSVLLTDALAHSANVVAATGAMDRAIDAICPGNRRLTASDVTPEITKTLREELARITSGARLLDASPRNGSRVGFLHAVFPRSSFVYIYRDPRRAVHEMMSVSDSGLEDLAREWNASTSNVLDDLERLPPEAWLVASYRSLTEEPKVAIGRVAQFLGIAWEGHLPPAPVVVDTPPDEVVARLEVVDDITRDVAARARDFFAATPPRSAPTPERAKEMKADAATAVFASVSTPSFPQLLHHLGITLVVSTYQSGRLILIRAESPTMLNTHFRMFRSPMGVAVGRGRMAIGTEREVWDYRNQPAVAAKVEPPGKHDACFVPRKVHVTGDIRIHEIGFAAGELWIVNTRFSTLCTLDADSSFVPRWRPPFVTALAAEDRCHLNGMAIVDDKVQYVTAFGTTDTAGGWRDKKATGGVLLDVDSGDVVLRGLSMPHSPRMHDGRFFILESGKGTIASADLRSGRVDTIAELPGFTRGLAFAGPFAFIGLSQVRETNIFGGIPLTERVAERECGVYVVDLRSGSVAAFLRFSGDVREIFDVQVLHGVRYPELLEISSPLVATSYTVPDESLAEFARD